MFFNERLKKNIIPLLLPYKFALISKCKVFSKNNQKFEVQQHIQQGGNSRSKLALSCKMKKIHFFTENGKKWALSSSHDIIFFTFRI